MKIIQLKNEQEDISIKEARQFECCKDMSDEQIAELLETIRKFTEITYSIHARNIDNQQVLIKPFEGNDVYKIAC